MTYKEELVHVFLKIADGGYQVAVTFRPIGNISKSDVTVLCI